MKGWSVTAGKAHIPVLGENRNRLVSFATHRSASSANTNILCSFALFLMAASFWSPWPLFNKQTKSAVFHKRPVTVEGGIQMTRLADPDYSYGAPSKGHVAHFSPDGKRFIVLLKKGNLDQNTNEFSLLLYRTEEALKSPSPDILLAMSSSSNRDAISKLRWLADNETLVFLGENPGEAAQIYALDIRARRLRKLTNHSTTITNYDITPDEHSLLFLADPTAKGIQDTNAAKRNGIVVMEQSLPNLLAGKCSSSLYCGLGEQELFFQNGEQPVIQVMTKDLIWSGCPLSFSPDGRYAVVGANIMSRDLPSGWRDYEFPEDAYLHSFFKNMKGFSPFNRYFVLDTQKGSMESLWDAPMLGFSPLAWAADGQSLFLRSYIPLGQTDSNERNARRKNQFPVEVRLPSREFHKIHDDEIPTGKSEVAPLDVTLEENINAPPAIYVSDQKAHQKALLLNLNPQFAELSLGEVEVFEWKAAKGIPVVGGLYLPRGLTPGKKYPLVIQTHGFDASRFSMDGLNEWSSGYAARALAANGIVVLQAFDFKNRKEDHDRAYADRALGATPEQAAKNFAVSSYERAIDELNRRGLIDPERVGIMGFSRTVCFVAYLLTHSKYRFTAATLVDGIDCGYFQYLAFGGNSDADDLNGGSFPFGKGLAMWLNESPGFNLDRVRTPVRLEAHGASAGLLDVWEWLSGLSRLGKPVECIYLPDADHLLVRPSDRRTSQQGAVDWFLFWLRSEEDSQSSKRDQYLRWRQLRETSRALDSAKN